MAVNKTKPITILVFFCFVSATICLELIESKNKGIKGLLTLISDSQETEVPVFRLRRSAKRKPYVLQLKPNSKTKHGFVKRSKRRWYNGPPPISHVIMKRYDRTPVRAMRLGMHPQYYRNRMKATSCMMPPYIRNGHVKRPTNYKYGSKVGYSCKKGYRLYGKATLVCGKNLEWSSEGPNCLITAKKKGRPKVAKYPLRKVKGCKRPGNISQGFVKLTFGYRYGSKAVYRCNKGYRLVGSKTIVCRSNGKWTPKRPACQKGEKQSDGKDLTGQLKKISKDIHEIEKTSGGKKIMVGLVITVIVLLLFTCHGIWVFVTRRDLTDEHNAVVKDGLVPVCDVPGLFAVSNSLCISLCCWTDSDLPTTFRPRKSKKRKSTKPSQVDLDNLHRKDSTSSRAIGAISKHGSLHKVGSLASRARVLSKQGSSYKVGSSASRASARSNGSLHGSEYPPLYPVPEIDFPELPPGLPPYIPPLEQDLDGYVQNLTKVKKSSTSKMDNNSSNHYWNDNDRSSRPCFYEHRKLKTGDKRKTQRSRRQRISMSPSASDGDPTMLYYINHNASVKTNGQSLKGKVSPVKYRYRNTNTNTNTDEVTKIPLYNAIQSSLTYTDYKEIDCIYDSLDENGSLKNDERHAEDYKYNLTPTDVDYNLYSKKRVDILEGKHKYEYIDAFDWFKNYNPDVHHNDTSVGHLDEVDQGIKERQGDPIDDNNARNGVGFGIFKTTVFLNTDKDEPLEFRRAHNPNHDHLNEVIKNVKQTRQHDHTRVTKDVRNAEFLIDPSFQKQNGNNQSKKNDILRENVQPEENSDSIEVIFDSSVQKATGNDASSQMIIDVSSASRENILAEYFEGALDLNFQKENGNNSSQIVDASRENVLPGEEPAFDEYTNDGTACSTDSSSTVIEAALSPLGQH